MAFDVTRLYLSAFASVLAWAIALWISKHAKKLRLVQVPNERSSHSIPTPSGGGIGIAVAGLCGSAILVPPSDIFATAAIALTLAAAFLGLLDDRFELSSRLRIAAHILIVGVVLLTVGSLPALHTPFGSVPVPLLYGLALLAGVWWINLFNFMDGIDGIAASEASFLCIGMVLISAFSTGSELTTWLQWWAVILSCACAGFLILNWAPARIFMGDVGSNYLAVAVLVIAAGLIASNTLTYATVLVLGASFITDATITLATRAFRGERWAAAHRLHTYQKLSRRWGTHSRVTLLYMLFNVVWLFPIAWLIQDNGNLGLLVPAAYVPAIAIAIVVGAGRPDRKSHAN